MNTMHQLIIVHTTKLCLWKKKRFFEKKQFVLAQTQVPPIFPLARKIATSKN